MSFNFTKASTNGKYEVHVDPVAKYGYFEHAILGDNSGGGLWFDKEGDTLTLTDYDGVFELPKPVAEALRELGCVVDSAIFN